MTQQNYIQQLSDALDNVNYDNNYTINSNLNLVDIENTYEKIKDLNNKLFTHLEKIACIEKTLFQEIAPKQSKTPQFVLAFDIDKKIYNKNFKQDFKTDASKNILIHKFTTQQKQIQQRKELSSINDIDISPQKISLPVVTDLQQIPEMFYWYAGDKLNKSGIYTKLANKFIIRVPFPNLYTSSDQKFKLRSIPCKYETKQACYDSKKKISELYNSEMRDCYYVHRKEQFIKVGSTHRCDVESFGNHDTLTRDLNMITNSDIKRLLMNSSSDMLLSNIWYQNKFQNGNLIFAHLDYY